MSARKDMRRAIRACQDAGLVYDATRKHHRLTHPSTGRFVSFSATPSCPHAYKHLLADVQKYLNIKVEL